MPIGARHLTKDAVRIEEIAAGAVGTEELADGAVTTAGAAGSVGGGCSPVLIIVCGIS
jgi:hypothetical protein